MIKSKCEAIIFLQSFFKNRFFIKVILEQQQKLSYLHDYKATYKKPISTLDIFGEILTYFNINQKLAGMF